MPISDPRDRFFYPHHTPMKDTYFPEHNSATIRIILRHQVGFQSYMTDKSACLHFPTTVDSRYFDLGYLEQPLISKRKSGPCLNLTSGNKILSIRGNFSPFPQYFQYTFLSKGVLITYSLVKFSCAICIFLNPENLICRTTDISRCFRGSLQLRDNESRLYFT